MTGTIAINAAPLTAAAYRKFGDVIAAPRGGRPIRANQGTARRFNRVADLRNLRPGRAGANLCVFRCRPAGGPPFAVRLLERHAYSTQAFVPLEARRYLAVVCLGAGRPDLSSLRAFVARRAQGLTYRPGVWHHPMIALDAAADFACLVWEDGSADDCEEVRLEAEVRVEWST